jgi:hypothetical protein
VHIFVSQPSQRVNRLMRLKNTGMVAIILLLKATWRILGFSISKKSPSVTSLPVHLPNPIHNRQYSTHRPAGSLSALERYFLRPDGSFEIDGSIQYFSDLVTLNTSNSSASNHMIQQKLMDNLTTSWKEVPHLMSLLCMLFFANITIHTLPVSNLFDYHLVMSFISESYSRPNQHVHLKSSRQLMESSTHLSKMPALHSTSSLMRQKQNTVSQKQLSLCIPPTNCGSSLFTCLPMNVLLHQLLFGRNSNNHYLKTFISSNGGNWSLAFSSALLEIAGHLREYGKEPQDYGLPQPSYIGNEVAAEIQRWSSDIPQLLSVAEQALMIFNPEQRRIFEVVWNAVQQNLPLCIFIDGKAGRGKTYLVNTLCSQVRGHGGIVLATATSAFAAQLYPGGRTTHSTFKVCMIILQCYFYE